MATILKFARKPAPANYSGRRLALNPAKAIKFQCGGFSLGPRLISAVVPFDAQMEPIRRALEAGILLDVTDNIAVTAGETELAAVHSEDTDMRAYFVRRDDGLVSLVIPKTEEEKQALEAQASRPLLATAPGMDNPDKYLLKGK